MSIDTPPQSWRTLLRGLTERTSERQRIADMLGLNTYTVTRWVNNETEPRASTLKRLPDVFPSPYREQLRELIQVEFYELHRIALHEMPLLSEKCQYTSVTQFRDRVLRLRREQEYRLSEPEAEALVLQQMEAELLDMSSE